MADTRYVLQEVDDDTKNKQLGITVDMCFQLLPSGSG